MKLNLVSSNLKIRSKNNNKIEKIPSPIITGKGKALLEELNPICSKIIINLLEALYQTENLFNHQIVSRDFRKMMTRNLKCLELSQIFQKYPRFPSKVWPVSWISKNN